MTLKKQITKLQHRIEHAAIASVRKSKQITLLAVSKTQSAGIVREAAAAGLNCFGENYLQEALVKIEALADLKLQWHFIGPIQSNKTKDIAQHFDWVQSVDRLKIAKRLAQQRPVDLGKLNVCIQVNIDNEASKSGILPENLLDFAQQIQKFEQLQLRGLMVIPTASNDQRQQQQSFQYAQQLYSQLAAIYPNVDTLSMGMSGDLEQAISAGSTLIRIGTSLFGERSTS